ncbi:hypothetical protein [Elizabethkingia meningoseptica]|uniref:hypothetical protein n=1 Tax=Elizabethkingia meningoseptica TaxID=238 RepID=UPI00162A967A|nr:hypothetical protein [Elizabethkingia meningoseptica]MBG0512911.1 hypothetical protein [Elizabethkingia meningoseptica]MBG0515178.1 hypothetical protein [Elizabethkingia meningoseptica]
MKLYREISVNDRSPDSEGVYTVVNVDKAMFQVSYNKQFGFHEEFTDCSGVTHWLEPFELPVLQEDWTEVQDDSISVPDELDPLLNKIGMQMNFVLYSDKNPTLAVCHILRLSEKFFYNQLTEKITK